jgi:hypothetical protein
MYLGKTYGEVLDNLRPLYPAGYEDQIIVAANKGIWLLTLKQAAYIKHHIARVTPFEITHGLSATKKAQIRNNIYTLVRLGVLPWYLHKPGIIEMEDHLHGTKDVRTG